MTTDKADTASTDATASAADISPADSDDPSQPDSRDADQSSDSDHQEAIASNRALIPVKEDRTSRPNDSWFNRVLALIGLRSTGSLRDDLEDALSETNTESALFSPEERAMLNNILRLREVRVEDVMVPRADVIAVDKDIPVFELLQLFEESGHSRMPVYDDSLDDPKGMVLIKDLMAHITRHSRGPKRRARKNQTVRPSTLDLTKIDLSASLASLKITRKVLFVPPSMLASDLMARMQTTRTQMALVIDEYGGTDGLVSLEDIVEQVVGEIEDEHDAAAGPMIRSSGDGIFTADARTDLEEAAKVIGDSFSYGELGEDVDTVGGLVFALAGRIPVRGEVVDGLPGFEFRVLDADPRRIKRLQIVQTRGIDRRRRVAKSKQAA
ncbi:MAG: hemolysin family protein [Pseudomonadota bacterium]